ncbi:MAG: serine/threonine protein kinase, partial [Planctomycetes bacterium]|nr:serine/threonine protein kinase [Planctomycetota bacterium]
PGYELLERLGEGSMGSVYKARQLSLDRIVALKLLATRLARDADYIKRFRREARLAAKLSHPNAVHVYNVEENARRHYIVMEFVDGPDVSKLIAKGPMGERAALEIIRGAALALGQAHEHGIIHRDIKPANILLTTKGQPKLSDLGLAKQVGSGSLTEHGLAVGTPFYMSPEQCRSDRGMDGRADIYSLGATLFHMLCGEPPFRGGGTLAIISKHVQEQLPDPRTRNPSLSDETAKLIQRMMAKDPVLRFQTCADLVKAVDKLLATIKDKAGTSTVVVPSDVGAASKEPDEHVAPTGFITWKARKRHVTAITPKGETKKEFTYVTNSIGMKFIHLPAGAFVMGS